MAFCWELLKVNGSVVKKDDRHIDGIDGLRGLAIVGITDFHIVGDDVPGGYMGVVLFFLLTGFLLSYGGVEQVKKRKFSIINYYIKRLKRIYPELIIMLLTSIGILYLIEPNAVSAVRPEVVSILGGFNNWWQISQSMDYFTRMLNASPFSHLWFLGVLLQYYLLWPLILGVIFYVQRHFGWIGSVVWLIILVLIASLWMPLLYYYQSDITRLYYGTDTRMFALLLGGLLGVVAHELLMKQISSGREDAYYWLKYIMAIILLVSVEMIYFLLDGNNKWVYQGGMIVVALIFAILLLLVIDRNTNVGKLLDNPVAAFLGKHSYGIYLWQYPLLYIGENYGLALTPWYYLLIWLITILLALWGEKLAGYLLHPHIIVFETRRQIARVALFTCVSLLGSFFMGVGCYGIAVSSAQRVDIQRELQQQLDEEAANMVPLQETQVNFVPSQVPNERWEPNLDGIICIGDSIMLGAAGPIHNVLPNCFIDAKVSRYVGGGVDVVKNMLAQKRLGEIVVIHLGTNGPIAGWDQYEVQTKELVQLLGDKRQIFWVNTYAPHLKWQNINNDYLLKLSREHPNITVVDWHGAVINHREWLAGDGIHPSREGAVQYARLLKETIVRKLSVK